MTHSRTLVRSEPIFLFILLLVLFTLGKFQGDQLRSAAIAVFSPIWSVEKTGAAKVIYRTPTLWNSTLWINLGKEDVTINSPVLKQGALIGVIDYVGQNQSRVRLITDAKFNPAVRVVRGPLKMQKILHDIDLLIDDFTFLVESKQESIVRELQELKEKLFTEDPSWYLAKGYLQGASLPLSKPNSLLLKGVGFNLDFSDHRSAPKDLHASIIKKNDLLITSGLDGLFPEGIPVAIVTYVQPLEEGDTHYTIQARPVATELQDLHEVDILPSLEIDQSELPPSWKTRF